MDNNELTPGQRKKALEGMAPAEVLALAQQDGYELTDDELDQVVGGADGWGGEKETVIKCTTCGSDNVEPQGMHTYRCLDCRSVFTPKRVG